VPSFEDFHIHPAISAMLTRLGWSSDHPGARDATPTAARGHNLVALTPPAPGYAAPVLAAVLSRIAQGRRAILLVPAAQLDEWGGLAHILARDAGIRVHVARGTARAARRLHEESVDCLVTTPETALNLVMRSVLRMETLDVMLLAWPESLSNEENITPLMQDLPKDAQRIIYTSESQRVSTLVERYARKALTVGAPGVTAAPAGPVRTTSTGWAGRLSALAELIELLDPASCVIWTVDQRYHEAITQAITATQPDVILVTGDAPPAATIIAFDLPSGDRLQQLLGAGDVVLLVPPGTEQYVASIAAPRRPLLLRGVLDAARATEAMQRRAITKEIEEGSIQPALLTLAPLFERHDAVAVAAALYRMWTGSLPAAPEPEGEAQATARIYVGLGKKDGANPNELVAVLTKELRVDRTKIGRIELRDAYSLIEVPAQDAEQVAAALNGTMIRRKRVTARVDQKPARSGPGDGRAAGRPPRRGDRR
jgi:ATP-dependent RNA helicase DeaD